VLYISYDGMTDQLGQSQVIPYLRELARQGYEITILSVEKKSKLEKTGKEIAKQLSDMGIEWETLLFTERPPLLSKIYDQWSVSNKAKKLYKRKKFDFVHCRSYVAAEAALKLHRKFSVPFLFDMRGFWVDERVDSGLWNLENPLYRFFYKLYKKKEKNYFKYAAHIVSLTHKGKEELINTYKVPADKISVIPCCVDLAHFDYQKISSEERGKTKNELGIKDDEKVISYLGSLGGWYMNNEMLDFFKMVKSKKPGLRFLFITHDSREKIKEIASSKKIDPSDIIVQPASRSEVPLYLSISDWNIFFIKDAYSKKASSPTKQGEVMAMGIPIICNDIGDTGRIINESNSGIVLKKFSTDEYAKTGESLQDLLLIKKENIREAAIKYFDLKQGVALYQKIYSQIVGKIHA